MKQHIVTAALLLSGAALAQPVQPPPKESFPVADALAAAPHIDITNGRITARITPPDLQHGFYRGTRFDQAGVVTSLKLGTREFYGPWFDRTAPEVLDYVITPGGMVAGPDSAVSGPVEEFAPLGFQPQPGLFVKIGVGVLRQPDTAPYDHYRHYEIVDAGKRETRTTKNSVTFTQTLTGAGHSYVYEKTLRLVPGTTRMRIEHRLKNTGASQITTTVYDHNFLQLVVPGNDGIRVVFPFAVTAPAPPPVDLIRVDPNGLTYLRPFTNRERMSFPIAGFGTTAADYDFTITDTKNGGGVHVRGDQPLARINIFSIDRVQAVEPYIAIDLAPGAEKRWSYTYDYAAGGR